MAWLARSDGTVVIGEGPFEPASGPPADGVAFLVHDFPLSSPRPWYLPARSRTVTAAAFSSEFGDDAPPDILWTPPDAAPFADVFQQVMRAIRGGVFEKTVPVVVEKGSASVHPAAAIVSAMARQPTPLRSYGWIAGRRGFAGATPELLISLAGDRLRTMALAGTARSEDREVFAVDEKEIREHEYVAQTLVAKLLDFGRMERHSREILDLGSLVHFLTHIRVDLRQPQTPDELIRRLHPTPALGPLPRTGETLRLLDGWRRDLGCPAEFGAPFGVWDRGRFDAVVAIRGVWWDDLQVAIPAGCGVIEASRLVNEWHELRLKRESVKRFLDP